MSTKDGEIVRQDCRLILRDLEKNAERVKQERDRQLQLIEGRIIHGSDYPLPPARLPFLLRTGLFPPERWNPLDMDLRIKRAYRFGPGYESQVLLRMNLTSDGPGID